MSVRRKPKLIIAITSILILTFVTTLSIDALTIVKEKEDCVSDGAFMSQIYSSNKYTRPDETTQSLSNTLVSTDGYEEILTQGNLKLYTSRQSLAIRILNTDTGYVWGSSFDTADQRLNKTWKGRVESALWIGYYKHTGISDELREETIQTNCVKSFQKLDNGFKAHVQFAESKIEMDFIVSLDNGTINVQVPFESITEPDQNSLAMIKVFPFLGANLSSDEGPMVEGYTLIPDGVGALVRYKSLKDSKQTFYSKQLYGKDYGMGYSTESETTYEDTTISVPLIGFVHGINRNALMISANEGSEYAKLISYEAGKTTDFYWTTFEFVYRSQYQTKISKTSSVITTQPYKNEFDISLDISVLSDDEANYVGIANKYHDNLVSDGILKENAYDDVPLHLTILQAEIEKTTFSSKSIPMTKTDDSIRMINELKDITKELSVTIQGWSSLGYSCVSPSYDNFNKSTGGKKGYSELITFAKDNDISLFFETDYQKGYARSNGFSNMKDLAQMSSSETITGSTYSYKYSYLVPEKSLSILEGDKKFYDKNGIDSLAFSGIASFLFSNWDNDTKSSMKDAIDAYSRMLEVMDHSSTYGCFEYVFKYVDEIYNTPLYSSQVGIFTDTVPFIPLVLKDSIKAFSQPLNKMTDLTDEVLRLIDYNVFPNVLFTNESAINLMETPSRKIVSSKYSSWGPAINDKYSLVKDALSKTIGSKLIRRSVLVEGVVLNEYENGTKIYINYTTNSYTSLDGVVIAKSFMVK